ncbi:methylated-DNA--[protein]-cysteine S-methyltransferase [Streptomyces sp. SID13031]|uniref:methylated-DNA--[protein]-cysteine S-methyltransferase n=1 Tax=Streptomyces sp. SID13031 TaxID=2706046 RepID=UPI0013CCEE4A|nr:methylated-DNA--[protein]-cysteine S-methyltransferase [Streptomyces sp. SID13031]NEA31710.1 methylated-DNA--[protein]-cysteine S-methyltransferase [Streptomyces sp. SID13031]
MNNRHAIVSTQLGDLTLVASDDALIGIYFPHHWVKPERATLGDEVEAATDPVLAEAARQLAQYLAGERDTFDLTTELRGGDAFQQQVWALLDEIPRGETTTYGELAERLGDKQLAQLVGKAVGSNPLSIIVPCHRVVGKDGKLTGYAGGLKRKQFLLDLEEPALVKETRLF